MTDIQRLPPWTGEGNRPETGVMQFGEDWPGIFIRGDNALVFSAALSGLLQNAPVGPASKSLWPTIKMLEGLRDLLASCSVGDTGWPP